MESYEEALDCFLKLHAILRNNPQVIWQLANMYPFGHDFYFVLVSCTQYVCNVYTHEER